MDHAARRPPSPPSDALSVTAALIAAQGAEDEEVASILNQEDMSKGEDEHCRKVGKETRNAIFRAAIIAIVQMRTNPLSGYGVRGRREPRFPRMDGVGTPHVCPGWAILDSRVRADI